MRSPAALVVRGDARALPLPDASVDLVVTSPPFYALRSYTDGGEHYEGQIGAEPTPAEYVANLIECTRAWMRVLIPTGSIWVNLGDKYGRPGSGADRNPRSLDGAGRGTAARMRTPTDGGGREKCLMLLPERYRIACVDQLGLIARAVVVWSKPNGLPESVTDRVRRSHEDWVHLTKRPRYYSAVDNIRTPHVREWAGPNGGRKLAERASRDHLNANIAAGTSRPHVLGALPGSVWEIATEPLIVPDHLEVDHFAAFPTEWPRQIILGWSPSGICVECGEGRRPVSERERPTSDRARVALAAEGRTRRLGVTSGLRTNATVGEYPTVVITGEVCACPEPSAPTRPSVILDPFGGTGTTALVARTLGRVGITVDRSADYCRLATWRTTDPAQMAKAMRVDPPPREHEDQLGLFDREAVTTTRGTTTS